MKETNNNQKAGLKYFLFIGIPVIIVLGILGAYYYATNPLTVITKTINAGYNEISKLLNYETDTSDTFMINGKLNINSKEFEELNNYDFDINIGIDKKNNNSKLELGVTKEKEELIKANLYETKDRLFLNCQKLYDKLIELPLDILNEKENINNTISNKDIDTLLKKYKDYFISSLNESYIDREKVDIKIENNTVKVTKVSYILDEKNQKRTIDFLTEKMMSDQEFLDISTKIFQMEKNEIINTLKEAQQNYRWENDYTINIFTEGMKQNVIRISFVENNENTITYINYKNQKTVNFMNNLTLTLNKIEKNEWDIDYNFQEEKINGKIKLNKDENDKDTWNNILNITMNSLDFNIELNLDLTTKLNETIEIPNIENSIKYEDLKQEELLEIFIKLENILKDTFIYNAIENNIM